MNHTLSETFDLDTSIQELQTNLYNELVVAWSTTKLDAYGRVYKNDTKEGIIPEVYNATTKGYKDTFYNNQSCFFFVDGNTHDTDDGIEYKAPLKIVFILKLSDLKTTTERADADVKRDVISLVKRYGYNFEIKGYLKTIPEVLREFNTDKLMENDLQPMHVFAVEGTLEYLTEKCT